MAEQVECWQCGGEGLLAGCFEDTCVCLGDPEDPHDCCSPSRCDVCKGKGGWEADAPVAEPPPGAPSRSEGSHPRPAEG